MSLQLIFMGTGTSAGVPMIGCECAVCRSDDPRDQRTRPSVLIRYPGGDGSSTRSSEPPYRDLLIDTTPDLRVQAMREHLMRLDAVLYTHAHADHILGIDDLRRFNAVMQAPLPIYAEPRVLEALAAMFAYIFNSARNVNPSFVAQLLPHVLEVQQPLDLYGAEWTPIRLLHGRLPILGFRIERSGRSIAYCTDVSSLPPAAFEQLQDLDVLVIDALRYRHHPTHMTVDQALEVIDRLQPGQAYLTHISHDIRHAELEPRLPENVFVAYDGLKVTLESSSSGEQAQASSEQAT